MQIGLFGTARSCDRTGARLVWDAGGNFACGYPALSRQPPFPGTKILQLFCRGTANGVWSRWRGPDGTWPAEQALGGILRWLASETHTSRAPVRTRVVIAGSGTSWARSAGLFFFLAARAADACQVQW